MHVFVFFFNDTATTEIYTLSLHDALPIFASGSGAAELDAAGGLAGQLAGRVDDLAHQSSGDQSQRDVARSEEHTSELQSQSNLVCRLLLEKKKAIDQFVRPGSIHELPEAT